MSRLLVAATLVLASTPAAAQSVAQRTASEGDVVLSGVPQIPASLAERFGPYQEVRSASVADWTSDGSGIYIRTRFGDVAQLHRVDAPGASGEAGQHLRRAGASVADVPPPPGRPGRVPRPRSPKDPHSEAT